jgi:hypothetical protein
VNNVLTKEEISQFKQVLNLMAPMLTNAIREGINQSVLAQPATPIEAIAVSGDTVGHRYETVWGTVYGAVINASDNPTGLEHSMACAAADEAVKNFKARGYE